jgi:hypothetical protein
MGTVLNESANASGPTIVTTQLLDLLAAPDIVPGQEPSYQLCKVIYLYHPLGAKMVESPIKIAMSEPREISVKAAPDEVVKAFEDERETLNVDYYIAGTAYSARTFGNGTLVCGIVGDGASNKNAEPLDLKDIAKSEIYFSYFDALNTAGSLVLNQDPNSPMFMKHGDLNVSGVVYHRSRCCVMYNELPVYLSYTSSAFGFNGRSVYQRALFPLKSFLQTMITDDMVTYKAGLIVAAIKQAGSIVSAFMQSFAGLKRAILQMAGVGNVISIGSDDRIESIDLQNIDKAMITARTNVIQNIAAADDMPAILFTQEAFANGFGEGSEDTKNIVRYVDSIRKKLKPLYKFTDRIVMHRAWNEEFYKVMKTKYPEQYSGRSYAEVFNEWVGNFSAVWPNLLREPDSELSKAQKVQVDGLCSIYTTLGADLDPANKAKVVQWVIDNVNQFDKIFPVGMDIDPEDIEAWITEQVERKKQNEDEAAKANAGGGDDE